MVSGRKEHQPSVLKLRSYGLTNPHSTRGVEDDLFYVLCTHTPDVSLIEIYDQRSANDNTVHHIYGG